MKVAQRVKTERKEDLKTHRLGDVNTTARHCASLSLQTWRRQKTRQQEMSQSINAWHAWAIEFKYKMESGYFIL